MPLTIRPGRAARMARWPLAIALSAVVAAQRPAPSPPGTGSRAAAEATTTTLQDAPPRLARAELVLQETVARLDTAGAGLVLLRHGARVHESIAGTWRPDHVVPIASATKWLTVATILTLVDAGDLALDGEVRAVLPEFERHAGLTLAHLLSCTHGLSGRPLFQAGKDATLASLAAAIAAAEVHEPPGVALRYGSTGFVVAARMAEVAGGADWHALFAQRIAEPLGMQRTRYGQIRRGRVIDAGSTRAPWVAGGAESTLDDYARFVAMLQAGGCLGETRVLSEPSVAAMFTPRTDTVAIRFSPYRDHPEVAYGLGTWIERRGEHGAPQLVSAGGAFGWMPWLDLERGVAGVLAVHHRWEPVAESFVPRRAELGAAVLARD